MVNKTERQVFGKYGQEEERGDTENADNEKGSHSSWRRGRPVRKLCEQLGTSAFDQRHPDGF